MDYFVEFDRCNFIQTVRAYGGMEIRRITLLEISNHITKFYRTYYVAQVTKI